MKNIILASSSPRRQELLRRLRIPFTVRAMPVDESVEGDLPPAELVEKLALRKARAVVPEAGNRLVIGADTIVTLNDEVLGKPADKEEAMDMLLRLNGQVHRVYTGLALVDTGTGEQETGHECTSVRFRPMDPGQLRAYVNTGEPMDKAGAYGIQGLGSILVSEINGCYYNVVGLPIAKLVEMLARFGVDVTLFWKTL